MNRFLLFAGDRYYPEGGWNDYKRGFDSRREAEKAARRRPCLDGI